MIETLLAFLTLVATVSGHSFLTCVDWRFKPGKNNRWNYADGTCHGYARRHETRFIGKPATNPTESYEYDNVADWYRNHWLYPPGASYPICGHIPERPDLINSDYSRTDPPSKAYGGKYGPMPKKAVGDQLCLKWDARNHQTSGSVQQNYFQEQVRNDKAWVYLARDTNEPAGGNDFAAWRSQCSTCPERFEMSFTNCPVAGTGLEESERLGCGGCFTVPDRPPGIYSLMWEWTLATRADANTYTNCGDVEITGGALPSVTSIPGITTSNAATPSPPPTLPCVALDSYWKEKITTAGVDIARVCKTAREWFVDDIPTCVAFGSWGLSCDASNYVCSGQSGSGGVGTFGEGTFQTAAVAVASNSAGKVHPDCPRTTTGPAEVSCPGWNCDNLGNTCSDNGGYTCCEANNQGCTDGTCWHLNTDLDNAGRCGTTVSTNPRPSATATRLPTTSGGTIPVFSVTFSLVVTVDRPPMEGDELNQWVHNIAKTLGIPIDQIKGVDVKTFVNDPNKCTVTFSTGTINYNKRFQTAMFGHELAPLGVVSFEGHDTEVLDVTTEQGGAGSTTNPGSAVSSTTTEGCTIVTAILSLVLMCVYVA